MALPYFLLLPSRTAGLAVPIGQRRSHLEWQSCFHPLGGSHIETAEGLIRLLASILVGMVYILYHL